MSASSSASPSPPSTTGWGKVILLGEHAVVHGYPALAGALDRGIRITAVPGPTLRLAVPAWRLTVDAEADHPVARALRAIAEALGLGRPALSLIGDAAIPPGAGLGSSAALAVAIARALCADAGRHPAPEVLAAAAGSAEAEFHHRPSGVDVALAIHGGLGVFRRASGLTALAAPPLRLLIGPSGAPRSTAAMVARVTSATDGDAGDPRLRELGALTDRGTAALLGGDLVALGRALARAQRVLAELGVSTAQLDELCAVATVAGAHGAKLTGGGGGGAVIALAPLAAEPAILAAWRDAGVAGFAATVGEPAPGA